MTNGFLLILASIALMGMANKADDHLKQPFATRGFWGGVVQGVRMACVFTSTAAVILGVIKIWKVL